MDGKSPHSTGLRPLSGPLPKNLQSLKENLRRINDITITNTVVIFNNILFGIFLPFPSISIHFYPFPTIFSHF